MTLVPRRLRRRDPFWDYDGTSARRVRSQRRYLKAGVFALTALFMGVVALNLPSVNTDFLVNGSGRPVLVGALMTLLATCVLVGLARLRTTAD